MDANTPEGLLVIMDDIFAENTSSNLLGRQLMRVWEQQAAYNAAVKAVQTDIPDWGTTYVLGIVGELAEIMHEMRWKRHRRYSGEPNLANIKAELVDLTKYCVSLWQHYGVGPKEMLALMHTKGIELDTDLARDFLPPHGRNVIITDLDGTVADFRAGFAAWATIRDNVKTLAVDLDNVIPYAVYEANKEKFEAGGGYGSLPPYLDGIGLLRREMDAGAWVLVATARPASKHQNIRQDTIQWLSKYGITPDATLFGRDERIMELVRLDDGANRVILLEDEPQLALRAANAGFHVILRDQPYNRAAQHPMVHRYTTFPTTIDWDGLFGGSKDA